MQEKQKMTTLDKTHYIRIKITFLIRYNYNKSSI